MITIKQVDLFGGISTREQDVSNGEWRSKYRKEKRKIERAKLKKLGEANYFYPTTGKNIYHCDGFVNGINGTATTGGYTVFKNGNFLFYSNEENKKGFTNNEAELLGVLACLQNCEEGDQIITDSMNTLAWVRSGKPKARPDLQSIALQCKELLLKKKVNLYWEKREKNLAGNYNEFEK